MKRRRHPQGARIIVGCKRRSDFLGSLHQGSVNVRAVSTVGVHDGSRMGCNLPPTLNVYVFSVKIMVCGKFADGMPLIRPLDHV